MNRTQYILGFRIFGFFSAWCLVLGIFTLTSLFFPQKTWAKAGEIYEDWTFRDEEDIRAWSYKGMEEAALTDEGLQFDIQANATMFRALPEGFHQHVDAIELSFDAMTLKEVALLFLTFDDEGKIVRRFRMSFLDMADGPVHQYIPLEFYRREVEKTEVLAMVYEGSAQDVTFDGIRFIHYSLFEKLIGAWKSFWNMQSFQPFTINILHGPVIVKDRGPFSLREDQRVMALSANAYFLVGIALFGLAMLFIALYRVRMKRESWENVRLSSLRVFLGTVFALWLFYDLRMGMEFLQNVAHDHFSFVIAEEREKEFRDVGKFPEFIAFAKPYLKDVPLYEFFTAERWPFFGMMRYETYPAKPNPGEPLADIWVIFNRRDMGVDTENRLTLSGNPITLPGTVLARFDVSSFIFRGQYAK
ncbi:MAG TPA: hypothetical protein VJB60_01225 [Candidatus Peribacterales bacterium]|nr:hypothetical protein [Candidatus Peribacterales bacterium]